MKVDNRQLVAPRPPVNLLVSIPQKSIRLSDTPPYPITEPARIKNGTAIMVKLLDCSNNAEIILKRVTPSHQNVK